MIAGAASAIVHTLTSDVQAYIGAGAVVSTDQSVQVRADHTSFVLSAAGGIAVSSKVGIGAAADIDLARAQGDEARQFQAGLAAAPVVSGFAAGLAAGLAGLVFGHGAGAKPHERDRGKPHRAPPPPRAGRAPGLSVGFGCC